MKISNNFKNIENSRIEIWKISGNRKFKIILENIENLKKFEYFKNFEILKISKISNITKYS